MTPEQLLDLKLDGDTTLRDVLYVALDEGAFGIGVSITSDEKEKDFYLKLAATIIEAVTK